MSFFINTVKPKIHRSLLYGLYFVIMMVLVAGCITDTDKLFNLLPPERTGVTFINEILEDEYINIISYEYLYNGAGVGIGDFNNDGLQDLFFCGNMVSNRLYLNKGKLKFDDITKSSGIDAAGKWCTGALVVDINNDGWQDLYVCASYNADPELRRNMMFINNGLNDEGLPSFTERAAEMGINDDGYTTTAAFFDYDNDGDLDLYVLTNVLDTDFPNKYRPKKIDGSSITNDRFYRNNGDGTFDNYTSQAKILYEGYGLGISIVDINQDGWKDIYITNDYLTNDLLYINNQDGTFSDQASRFTKHTGHSAMGHDIADINNDALPDIFTLDMLPDDNQRLKQMYAGSRFSKNTDNDKYGYEYQYKRNMLQLNRGADAYGNHLFSEIGFFSNTYATDWSWSALLADFDNDGYRDLFISNGYPRDVTDLDYATSGSRRGLRMSMEEELGNIPVRHIPNYLFINNGNCSFTDRSLDWGFELPSFSNGAAYVDLDNDGDLDLVANNINEPAFIYENRLYSGKKKIIDNHYLRFWLISQANSGIGVGARIYVFLKDQILYTDYSIYHGFMSTVEPIIHFGLGMHTYADSVIIIAPEGRFIKMYDIPADQVLTVNLKEVGDSLFSLETNKNDSSCYILKPIKGDHGIQYLHKEEPFNDFNIQPAIPFQISQAGPGISVADLDNDGKFDLFIGGSKKYPGHFFFQKNGKFKSQQLTDKDALLSEDQGSLLFDADGDGNIDLYAVSGSNEQVDNSPTFQDRLYMNDGQGNFRKAENALPEYFTSGTCIKGADIDKDGDIDLFIGGGAVPGKYPFGSSSYILRNDSEPGRPKFVDITTQFCPGLGKDWIIHDALWTDFDNDSNIDLILAGEWTPITIFRNSGTLLEDVTGSSGIENFYGWWNSLAGGDFDNDGDIDYLAGNHGLNSFYKASFEEPLTAYAADFDNNGRSDIVMARYGKDIDGTRKIFPLHFRNDINLQMDLMKKRFPSFKEYSEATIDSIFTKEEMSNALTLSVNYLQSAYIENLGNGKFRMNALPLESQYAPIYGFLTGDFNNDRFLDVLLVGNFFGNNPFWGRIDALNGLLLLGSGNGKFEAQEYVKTGFLVPGDAKAIVELPYSTGKNFILVTQNQDSLSSFSRNQNVKSIVLHPEDAFADIVFDDGSLRKQEFYYGNSYLSQSARVLDLPGKIRSYKIYSYKNSRSKTD